MKTPPKLDEPLIAVTPEKRYTERKIQDATVTKVGRKYFTIQIKGSRLEEEFCLARWKRKGDNTHANFPILLFRTMQEMDDYYESKELSESLSKKLCYRSDWEKLSVDQLRQISEIVNKPTP